MVRHGETDWNRDGRFQGHADPPLNETGHGQARALAAQLASTRFDAVYSSDLRRAVETARVVASRLGLSVSARADLREADVGVFTGLTREEIAERFPAEARLAHRVGFTGATGEGFERLSERIIGALVETAAAHPDQRVLVVTHGGPIRVTLASADGMTVEDHRRRYPPVGNGTVHEIVVVDGRLRRID